jgi:hypothetical protein
MLKDDRSYSNFLVGNDDDDETTEGPTSVTFTYEKSEIDSGYQDEVRCFIYFETNYFICLGSNKIMFK